MAKPDKLRACLPSLLALLVLIACSGEPTATPVAIPEGARNQAPSVAAAAQLTREVTLELHGKVSDDTLPSGSLALEWTKVSGPGPVSFAEPQVMDTIATFVQPGTYVLRLTATDGELTTSDDLTVTVQR